MKHEEIEGIKLIKDLNKKDRQYEPKLKPCQILSPYATFNRHLFNNSGV